MLIRLIAKIRQKQKHVKDNIAFGVAGIFTFIVFSFWAYSISSNFGATGQVAGEGGAKAFTQFFGGIKDQVASVRDSVSPSDELTSSSDASLTPGEYLTETVQEYIDNNQAASASSSIVQPKEVRIITIKASSSSSTQDIE